MKCLIYLCKYIEVEQVIPRHHVAGYSKCEYFKTMDLEALKNILKNINYDELVNNGETVITDPDIIDSIIGYKPVENLYLRIRLVK